MSDAIVALSACLYMLTALVSVDSVNMLYSLVKVRFLPLELC